MASILLWFGGGRTPFTDGDGGKEPYCCGKLTPMFLRNDEASECLGTALSDKAAELAETMIETLYSRATGPFFFSKISENVSNTFFFLESYFVQMHFYD